jgi:hypothetical protein
VKALYSSLSEPVAGRLENWSVLRCEGPDAEAFLQSQLSSDVAALSPGGAQWSAWLSPKGRVLALILLWRRDNEVFELLLPDHPAESLAPALSRFILRRKAKLSLPRQAWILAGIGTEAPAAAVKLGGMRARWLTTAELPAPADAPRIDLPWKRLDLVSGVPRIAAEGGGHTAHMLGLDRLQAISLAKGCYPGQEIVARTHYLGQSKRSLCCLWVDHPEPPAVGTPLSLAGQTVGEVVSAVGLDAGLSLIQAVVSALQDGARLECGSATAQPVALVAAPVPLP